MIKLLTATLATTLVIGLAGCKSTPKTTSADEPRTLDNAPQRLGDGIGGAAQGPINAVKSGADAIGDAFKGDDKDKKKSDHPDKKKSDHPNKKKSDHPDHPGL